MVRCEWRAKTRALGRTPVLTLPCLTSSAKSFLKLLTPIVNSLISHLIFSLHAYSLLLVSWISSHGYRLHCVCGGGNPGTFKISLRYEVINNSNLYNARTENSQGLLYYLLSIAPLPFTPSAAGIKSCASSVHILHTVHAHCCAGWLGKSKKSRVYYGCGHLGESQIFLVLIVSILYNMLTMFYCYYSLLCFNLFQFLCNPTGQVLIVESLTFNSTCTANSNLFDGEICA